MGRVSWGRWATNAVRAIALVAAIVAEGCGRSGKSKAHPLTFEELSDTTGLSKGAPVLAQFEPYRLANGVVRVRGALRFPDDTRVQISVRDPYTRTIVAQCQVLVENGRFDTPPIIGEKGPLPIGNYHFELLAHFNTVWQLPNVLAATDTGRSLRGPGITRGRMGQPAFFLEEDRRL